MNGRMYDPHLGRFLSADPTIQDPSNSQCLNRYSYCVNNPICYTDPTGFSWWGNLWKSVGHLFHDIGHEIDSVIVNRVVGTVIQLTLDALAVVDPVFITAAVAFAGYRTYLQTGNAWRGVVSGLETELEIDAWSAVGTIDSAIFTAKGSSLDLT